MKALTLIDVWAIALTDDVELRGRQVWSRPADWFSDDDELEPMTFAGELAPEVTEEQFYAEVAEAYSK